MKLNLLVRGSTDGFSGQKRNEKSNFKGRTVTLVRSTTEKIFGGYTDLDWDEKHYWKIGAKNIFLFSFIDEKTVLKFKCMNADVE